MKKIFLIANLIISLFFIRIQNCSAGDYLDFYLIQFAGEIGLLSGGVGRRFSNYEISGMYGIVPAGVSRVGSIETIALRQTLNIYQKFNFKFYIGLNVFHVLGLDYQTGSYRDVPQNYYATGATRVLMSLGTIFYFNKNEGIYFESGITDIWVENYIRNQSTINPSDHLSLSLGYKSHF